MVLNLIDLFGTGASGVAGVSKIWDRLGANVGGGTAAPFGQSSLSSINLNGSGSGPFAGLVDIVDIAITQAQLDPTQMQIVKYIRPLPVGGQAVHPYFETYVGCTITNVTDGESIDITTLQIIKQITVAYRYLTRNGQKNQAFNS